jgi:eukaryotic-like serine/threonine-protein kinase
MADPIFALREGLRDRYEFERELGRGGMATVWLARDLRHDRPVALKVLHPELAAALGPERFQREIRTAARLQHPHVLTVLDSGAVGERLWFTMPFVEGESLRDRIRRERQLPVEEAVRIAREAAQALQYAHDQGIIHRDIKPENLLLTRDGNTLVADFGIARALGVAGDEQLTETGLVVGTPAYMSPEQAAGDKSLDARTDVYSLAAVLYEMLAGQPPYVAATTQALIMKRLTDPPPSARAVRPNVPEAVDHAIRKALAPVPADRFGSAAELGRELAEAQGRRDAGAQAVETVVTGAGAETRPAPRQRRPRSAAILVLGFVLGLGVLFGWLRRHGDAAGDAEGLKRLAVLPFDNLGSAEDEYFADGVTDEIRAKLAGVQGLQVTASRSAAEYKKSSKDLATIARELGVDYLLVGKVRWEKGEPGKSRVRVSPELIRVATGSTEWEQPFDANFTDVFKVQADVAGQVARALDVALGTTQEQALEERPTANAAAYDVYLRGEAASEKMAAEVPKLRIAIGHYEQAVALDSGFAQAWAQLSRAHSTIYFTTPTPEGARQAREAAARALRMAPDYAGGYQALGDYYSTVPPLDYERAIQQYETGLRLAPNDAELLAADALAELSIGRWEAALAHLTRARSLDPRSRVVGRRLAYSYIRLRRYPEGVAAADRALALDSTDVQIVLQKVMAFLGQGDLAKAQETVRRASGTVPPADLAAFLREHVRALLGAAAGARGAAGPPRAQLVRRPRRLGDRPGPDARAPGASGPGAQLRRFRTPRLRRADQSRPGRCPGPCLLWTGAHVSRPKGGGRGRGRKGGRAAADLGGRVRRPLCGASARADLPAGGRAGQGDRHPRPAAQDPVLPLAGVAPARSRVRAAPRQPPLRSAGERGRVMG